MTHDNKYLYTFLYYQYRKCEYKNVNKNNYLLKHIINTYIT